MTSPLKTLLPSKNVIVCVGSGGVGKTTVAATLALEAALEGKKSLVCTIDPAKRLANSLGLTELGNQEAAIAPASFVSAGLEPNGVLHAMMLDMKQTWDDLIARYAPPDKRQKILENRFYQSLSSALAGSQEYIAMEKLWELRSQRDYQLIVLDTPPTAHALDFLDNDAAKFLLTPALAAGRVGLQLFSLGSSYVAKTLSRFTGAETLQELAKFLLAISGLNQGFRERAHQVRGLLASPQTSFVLVTAPMPERIDEAVHFHTVLQQNQMHVGAIVVNRVHPRPTATDRAAAEKLSEPLRGKVLTTLKEQDVLASQDEAGIARLREQVGATPLIFVPRFELDVHDLKGLHHTGEYLLGDRTITVGG
ncbi:MAG: ArsA family ATPase [Myxococcaceae bacterium]